MSWALLLGTDGTIVGSLTTMVGSPTMPETARPVVVAFPVSLECVLQRLLDFLPFRTREGSASALFPKHKITFSESKSHHIYQKVKLMSSVRLSYDPMKSVCITTIKQ